MFIAHGSGSSSAVHVFSIIIGVESLHQHLVLPERYHLRLEPPTLGKAMPQMVQTGASRLLRSSTTWIRLSSSWLRLNSSPSEGIDILISRNSQVWCNKVSKQGVKAKLQELQYQACLALGLDPALLEAASICGNLPGLKTFARCDRFHTQAHTLPQVAHDHRRSDIRSRAARPRYVAATHEGLKSVWEGDDSKDPLTQRGRTDTAAAHPAHAYFASCLQTTAKSVA